MYRCSESCGEDIVQVCALEHTECTRWGRCSGPMLGQTSVKIKVVRGVEELRQLNGQGQSSTHFKGESENDSGTCLFARLSMA